MYVKAVSGKQVPRALQPTLIRNNMILLIRPWAEEHRVQLRAALNTTQARRLRLAEWRAPPARATFAARQLQRIVGRHRRKRSLPYADARSCVGVRWFDDAAP
jgi:hypothetical protein